MKSFPSKVITAAFEKAQGQVFTWSPGRQIFTDSNGSSDYNYSAMLWLKENGFLVKLPWDPNTNSIVYKFKMKDAK